MKLFGIGTGKWILALWGGGIVLLGGIFTSFHQPFQSPNVSILTLLNTNPHKGWRLIHVLSPACGCSRKVMTHLLSRRPAVGISEQVLTIDEGDEELPDSVDLLARLKAKGFFVTRLAKTEIPATAGIYGVPLLIIASPEGKIAYSGGYGSKYDSDTALLDQARAAKHPKQLPILGCAIGSRVRSRMDPFHFKY